MVNNKDFNVSYWETRQYLAPCDLLVVGAGIVGLSTAISYKEQFPDHSVVILERGVLPDGASTKNAGFACFGTAGELLDDLSHMDAQMVWETVKMRWEGLRLLRSRLGDDAIGFEASGGHELFFSEKDADLVQTELGRLNQEILNVCGIKNCFGTDPAFKSLYPGAKGMVRNRFEGVLNTGLMMRRLTELAVSMKILILNGIAVESIASLPHSAVAQTSLGDFEAQCIVLATNGLSKKFLPGEELKPARAQVLVTSVVNNLKIKGAYHFDRGYYYFRDVDGRILFGGGRNLAMDTEETTENQLNPRIQGHLESVLREQILPGCDFDVDMRWTGIMGVGPSKLPIIRRVNHRVIAAVRMGGMGIAIGSLVGQRAAAMAGGGTSGN